MTVNIQSLAEAATIVTVMLTALGMLSLQTRRLRTGVRGDLAEFRTGVKGDLAEFRTGVRGDLAEFRTGVRGDLAEFRTG